MCISRREDLVHGIKHRAKRSNSAVHAIHAFDGDKHTAFSLPERGALVPKRPERSVQRRHVIVREGTAHALCDAGGSDTVVHGGVDVVVVEQGVAGLRHAGEEARVGVEARVEEESRRGAEGPRKARFKLGVRMVVHDNAGAPRAEDRWCCVERGKETCAEERGDREGEVVVGGEVDRRHVRRSGS